MYRYGSIVGIIALLCTIWVIYDVFVNQKGFSTGRKVAWTIFAVLFNIVTALIYYVTVKMKL